MAIMPTAHYAPINYSGVPRMRSAGPNVLIFHTIVGHDPAPAAHFSLGGYGELTQSRDTLYQSAACLDGNPRALACETEDLGAPFPAWDTNNGHDVPAWSEPQLDRAVEICVWVYHTHGIPLQLAADSKTGSAGIAYHRQGIDSDNNFSGYAYGGRVSGGEHWSSSKGKVCPGDRRIKQLIEIVIPRARVAAGLDEDVALTDTEHKWLEDVLRRVQSMHLYGFGAFDPGKVPPPAWQNGGDLAPIWKSMDSPEAEGGSKRLDDIDSNVKTLQVGGVSAEEIVAAMAVDENFLGNLAGAFADEMDRRNRDGDSATGQPS